MDINTSKHHNALVIALHGRLDASSTATVEKSIIGAIDGGEKWLVIDLGGMDYVSSIGLRVFVLAAKRLKTVGGDARFCCLQEPVQRIFEMAGLTPRMNTYASREEALAGFPPA